jgi:hypothetical protein
MRREQREPEGEGLGAVDLVAAREGPTPFLLKASTSPLCDGDTTGTVAPARAFLPLSS